MADPVSRIHDPTPRRQDEARQQGHVPRSAELAAAGHWLAACVAGAAMVPAVAAGLAAYVRQQLAAGAVACTGEDLVARMYTAGQAVAQHVLPVLGVLLAAAVAMHLVQTGPVWQPARLVPQWTRLDPRRNAGQWLSPPQLVRLGLGLVAALAVAAVCGWDIHTRGEKLASLALEPLSQSVGWLAQWLGRLAWKLAAVVAAAGAADFAFRRWWWHQQLRMSEEELREELRDSGGDRTWLHQQRAALRRRLAESAVPRPAGCQLVVLGEHVAVGLRYRPQSMRAPVVAFCTTGEAVGGVRAAAASAGVPLVEQAELAAALCTMAEVGRPIPQRLHPQVAQLLASRNHLVSGADNSVSDAE